LIKRTSRSELSNVELRLPGTELKRYRFLAPRRLMR